MRRLYMPKDAVHGTTVHETKDSETINEKQRSQHRNSSFKSYAETKMFPMVIVFPKNTEHLDIAVEDK